MGDFVQSPNVKSAVRKLANPSADVDVFNTIVQAIITANPFGCVSYMSGGVTHQSVEKSKEAYVAKIAYEDANAKSVGTGSHRFGTIAGFNAGIATILVSAPLATAHAGTAARNSDTETYSAILRCHDTSGELFFVTISRDQVSLTSYTDDAIRTKVKTLGRLGTGSCLIPFPGEDLRTFSFF